MLLLVKCTFCCQRCVLWGHRGGKICWGGGWQKFKKNAENVWLLAIFPSDWGKVGRKSLQGGGKCPMSLPLVPPLLFPLPSIWIALLLISQFHALSILSTFRSLMYFVSLYVRIIISYLISIRVYVSIEHDHIRDISATYFLFYLRLNTECYGV